MGGDAPEWERIRAEIARNRRDLGRQMRRTRRRTRQHSSPLEPVAPARARRRALLGMAVLTVAWAGVLLIAAALIRAHVWGSDAAGLAALLVGIVVGAVGSAIWYGNSRVGSGGLEVGSPRISARTLTGTRTIDLDRLTSVRRFSAPNHFGRSTDAFRLKDVHGVRLTIDRDLPRATVDAAVRQAIERAQSDPAGRRIRVTRHARTALGMTPRSRIPQGLHVLWSLCLTCVVMIILGYINLFVVEQLSG